MFFEGLACNKHPKYRPKYDLENERPPKSQKVVFVIILGFVLGGKSTQKRIKIEVKIRARKKWKKEGQKSKKGRQPQETGECDGLRVPPSEV